MKQVQLIPYVMAHVPKTVSWANDKEIMYLIDRSGHRITINECRQWCRRVTQDTTKRVFAILDVKQGIHIGNCGFSDIDRKRKKAKLWIYIGEKSCWGKGFGKQALRQLLYLGFGKLKLHRIYLYIIQDNVRAGKLYESAGFVKEGVFRDDTFLNGKYRDTVYYALLKDEYGQGRIT